MNDDNDRTMNRFGLFCGVLFFAAWVLFVVIR